jgi:hypothetical protein
MALLIVVVNSYVSEDKLKAFFNEEKNSLKSTPWGQKTPHRPLGS